MYLVIIIFVMVTAFGKTFNESNHTKITKGDLPNPAIISGYESSLAEFPFAARLYTFPVDKKNSPLKHTCTAEIIHPSLVITAANCVNEGGDMVVVAGEGDQNDYKNGVNMDKYKEYRVEESFIHPLYNPITNKHDLAILLLEDPMSHPGFTTVPISFKRLEEQKEAKIFGWGATLTNQLNNVLYAKNVTVETCTKETTGDYEFLCLMSPGTKTGDAGGPIIIDGKLRGICSHFQSFITTTVKTKYYYTSLWEEKEFVEIIMDKNGAGHVGSFLCLAMASITFIK